MNVLLIGHACGPGMGSEPGYTWNWALQLSRQHRVWVVTHPQFRTKVETWLEKSPQANLQFIWVDVESVFDPWTPAKGERGIQIHYLMWLRTAYSAARQLCREVQMDIAHHVSWGTLRAAPPFWLLPVPTVWGPLGGGQCAPLAFLRYFGASFWQELFRSFSSRVLGFSPRFRKGVQSAALILATNRESETLLRRVAGARVSLFLDCGLPADWVPEAPPEERRSGAFTLLWAGRLEHRKALALGLRALSRVRSAGVRLLVAGSGPLRNELEALAKALGLQEKVTFLGSVPYIEMQALFQRSDAFLFTSLRDSFGSVVLEAMAQGLPLVTLDHQGVGTFVPDEAAVKVPVTVAEETIEGLAAAIDMMANSPAACRQMQLAAWDFASRQTWDRRAQEMTKVYEQLTNGRELGISSIASSPAPVVGMEV